jgi:hypothetical protein
MSLDRPDVKVRFDPEYHRALKRIADAKGITMGEWLEDLAVTKIRELVHEASVIAESAPELGISGNHRAQPGISGRVPEREGKR